MELELLSFLPFPCLCQKLSWKGRKGIFFARLAHLFFSFLALALSFGVVKRKLGDSGRFSILQPASTLAKNFFYVINAFNDVMILQEITSSSSSSHSFTIRRSRAATCQLRRCERTTLATTMWRKLASRALTLTSQISSLLEALWGCF